MRATSSMSRWLFAARPISGAAAPASASIAQAWCSLRAKPRGFLARATPTCRRKKFGSPLDWQSGALARGDLVFWDGHVGIMTSAQDLVHASAYHMVVVEEPLAEAKARIAAASGGDVIGARRPERLSRAGR